MSRSFTEQEHDGKVDVRCPFCERLMGKLEADVGHNDIFVCHHCRYRWYVEIEFNPTNTTDFLVTVEPASRTE